MSIVVVAILQMSPNLRGADVSQFVTLVYQWYVNYFRDFVHVANAFFIVSLTVDNSASNIVVTGQIFNSRTFVEVIQATYIDHM